MSLARRRVEEHPRDTITRVLKAAGADEDIARKYAEMICSEYSGEDVYFAIKEWQTLEERNEQIRAAACAGRSLRKLAEDFCLSKSTVQRILAAVD